MPVEKCRFHPWFSKYLPEKVQLNYRNVENMMAFGSMNPLKKLAMTAIAQRLPDTEIKAFREMFDAADENGDGIVTTRELKKALKGYDEESEFHRQKMGHQVESYRQENAHVEVKDLMKLIDVNGTGELDFSEFVAAMLPRKQYQDSELVQAAFEQLDSDRSGCISLQELTECLLGSEGGAEGEADTEYIEEILAGVDSNNDGTIDRAEFEQMMKKPAVKATWGKALGRNVKSQPIEDMNAMAVEDLT